MPDSNYKYTLDATFNLDIEKDSSPLGAEEYVAVEPKNLPAKDHEEPSGILAEFFITIFCICIICIFIHTVNCSD